MNKYTEKQLKRRAFNRVASVMFGMWEEKGSSDPRLLDPPLIPDEYVEVGESVNGKNHREHVIPRAVICYECHAMFKNGKSVDDVAEFIEEHLKIVYISKEEKHKLDSGSELNLRQNMPDGWLFENGDIYARLHAAKIDFKEYQNNEGS